MKKTFLVLLFALICNISNGQNKVEAEKLVNEGVAYHDKGDFDGALSKYDKALELDKENLLALAEKAYSLFSLQRYDESINCCQRAITAHPGDKGLKTVYVTFGNALDGLKKTDKSIEIYDLGIKEFPDYYHLHFNKGVSLSSVKKYEEAILCFQKAVLLNPKHASSHNAIARLSNIIDKRIPSILAYCRFLVIETKSNRAKENLSSLQNLMKGNTEKTGEKSVTIHINSNMFGDTTENGKPTENSFVTTDLILAFDAVVDFDKKNKKKTEIELFLRKFETICASLKETYKDNYGFFWDYYVPYFIEMKDNNFLETFSYIVLASGEDAKVSKWLKENKSATEKFYEWSKSYKWKTN